MQPITEPQKAERRQRLEALHLEFFKELQETGWGFHPEIDGGINERKIELWLTKDNGAINGYSEVEFYVDNGSPAKINFGSSGSFTPENIAPYWRTKHAAIILDNWNAFHEIAKRYCERYQNEFLNQ
jgi:hypothetical protein